MGRETRGKAGDQGQGGRETRGKEGLEWKAVDGARAGAARLELGLEEFHLPCPRPRGGVGAGRGGGGGTGGGVLRDAFDLQWLG